VQPRHAVTSRLELDAALRASGAVTFGDGLDLQVFAECAGLAAQGRGRDRGGGHGEVLVELGAQSGVATEVGRLLDDDSGMPGADLPVAHRPEGDREFGREGPRL
jgi:hypothetical protein